MKTLDTRQTSEEVVVMSWSPKMDLLAVGNKRGHVHLHRLSWQKVWTTQLTIREETCIPQLMAWHPEGLFLIVASGDFTFVIEVEGGKVVHNHELPFRITSIRWCTSQFQHPMHDVLYTQTRQTPPTGLHQPDLKIQRLELNLSVLFLGTCNGYVYSYTGGFLLGLVVQVGDVQSSTRLLQMEASSSLESFIFLSDEEAGAPGKTDEMTITFSHFTNNILPRMAPIIGPLGLKYILFLKAWAMVQVELNNLNDVWGRMVDLYLSYMTFGGTRSIENVRVDFLELLLTGISSVEMEIFLGSVGRKKEAKKNANLVNTSNAAMTDHIRTAKCSITNLLTELNEIGGFLQQISGYEEASNVIVQLRKAGSYLFLAVEQIQSLVHSFSENTLHFMHLVMNTIHTFNVQELPDFIEEDADTDKVLEFLHAKVERDIFKYMFQNAKIGYSTNATTSTVNPETSLNLSKIKIEEDVTMAEDIKPLPKKKPAAKQPEIFSPTPNKYVDFANFIRDLLAENSSSEPGEHPLLLDYSDEKVASLVLGIVPTINKLTKSLLSIPVLCSVPFQVDDFPLIRLPKTDYFLEEDNENSSSTIPLNLRKRKTFHLLMQEQSGGPLTSKTLLTLQLTSLRLLAFEVDIVKHLSTSVKGGIFIFSRPVVSSQIFSSSHVTIVSYDKEDRRSEQQDIGRTILCHIPLVSLMSSATPCDVSELKTAVRYGGVKANLPLSLPMTIPLDVCKPIACPPFDFVLPIEGFAPSELSVSGQRKVGALLGDNRRTLILLDMDTEETNESTLEDDDEEEEEES